MITIIIYNNINDNINIKFIIIKKMNNNNIDLLISIIINNNNINI